MQRQANIEPVFKHELTATPTAYFSGFSLRKADKSLLAKELTASVSTNHTVVQQTYVVDGGWLLHKVKWRVGGSYADTAKQYLSYVGNKFGRDATIVFDGYRNGPTVKGHEQDKRA